MKDSIYYYDQMNYWKKEIKNATNEKDKYEKILIKIKNLNTKLPSIKDNLIDAENKYKEGGYLDNGETFDKGILKNCYEKIEVDINTLNTIISNYNTKINNLGEYIKNCQRKYNTAKNNYNESKILEEENGV